MCQHGFVRIYEIPFIFRYKPIRYFGESFKLCGNICSDVSVFVRKTELKPDSKPLLSTSYDDNFMKVFRYRVRNGTIFVIRFVKSQSLFIACNVRSRREFGFSSCYFGYILVSLLLISWASGAGVSHREIVWFHFKAWVQCSWSGFSLCRVAEPFLKEQSYFLRPQNLVTADESEVVTRQKVVGGLSPKLPQNFVSEPHIKV